VPRRCSHVIETARLILRPPIADDLDAWTAFVADPDTMRFLGGVKDRTAAWRGLATMAGSWTLHGFAMFSVVERATNRWIGRVGPWQPAGWPGPEIAWGLARGARGRGYATEAALASMAWARANLGWASVIHLIHPDNAPSIALAERLGSRRLAGYDTGAVPGGPMAVYGQDLATSDSAE